MCLMFAQKARERATAAGVCAWRRYPPSLAMVCRAALSPPEKARVGLNAREEMKVNRRPESPAFMPPLSPAGSHDANAVRTPEDSECL